MSGRINSRFPTLGVIRAAYASGAVLLATVTLLTLFKSRSTLEPVYAGRSVTEWLDGGYEPAAMALQELGPSAVPWIFKNLRREHPGWAGCKAYVELHQHTPALLLTFFPVPKATGFDELRAANLLIGMGPPVVPALKAGLKDRNPAVKSACKLALANLSPKTAVAQPQ